MNKLLERQLRRHFPDPSRRPPALAAFLKDVEAAYDAAETDRALLERSLDLTSEELSQRYAKLRNQEEQLRAAVDRLKDVDKFRSEFLNNAAHELGTPLTPIKLQIHMLKNQVDATGTPEQQKSLDIVDRSIVRLERLVGDILDAGRLQTGRLRLQNRPTELDRIVQESADAFEGPARSNGVRLEVGHLDPTVVIGDPTRLAQVVTNLLANAIKFTPPGGRIIVECIHRDDGVVVRVEDSGIGIRAEDISRLFQPFSQVHDTMQRTAGGTGLGLFISRGIIEDAGGSIWCESAGRGRGSVFQFFLPIASIQPKHLSAQAALGDALPARATVSSRP